MNKNKIKALSKSVNEYLAIVNPKKFYCAIVNTDGSIGLSSEYPNLEAFKQDKGVKETDTLLQIKLDYV
jgi:hypothetical protein